MSKRPRRRRRADSGGAKGVADTIEETDMNATNDANEQAIRQLIEDRAAALRAGDAVAACATYAPAARVFSLAPPLVQAFDSARDVASLQAWIDDKGGSVWTEVRDLVITVDGDLALATSIDAMGAPPEAPQPFTLWYRSTLGLRRLCGEWQIVHEHTSTPFHMDGSFRAAIDLQP
jgi:ketosteroid isomerase-like protein